MIGAAPAPSAPQCLGELRSAEVYVQVLSEGLGQACARGAGETLEALATELAVVASACAQLRDALRLALRRLDPSIAIAADAMADMACQRAASILV